VSKLSAATSYFFTPSTYTCNSFTGLAGSVVPALISTGDVMLAPFTGEQMVTEGDALLSWQEGVAWAEMANAKTTRSRKLTLNGMGTQGFGRTATKSRFLATQLWEAG
jgi:hypothetical protein